MSKIFDWDDDELVDTNVVIKEELIKNIVPNPTDTATKTLRKIKLGKDTYEISGGSGEPATYIKDIEQASNTYTATKKDNTTIAWTIPDTTTLVPKNDAELTGTTQVENIVVGADITAKSGTPETDFDMSNAKTFVIPSITLTEPSTATSGTITELQLATLQSTNCAYIIFNGEKYYLNDKEHTVGSLGYSHCGFENNQFIVRNITITISTRGWVLTTGYVNTGHLYQHCIRAIYRDSTNNKTLSLEFCVFTYDGTKWTSSNFVTNITDYVSGLGLVPLLNGGESNILVSSNYYPIMILYAYGSGSSTSPNNFSVRYQTTYGSTITNTVFPFAGNTTWVFQSSGFGDNVIQLR